MNGKQEKKIRAKAKAITVDWLKSLMNKEEADKITIKNYANKMPRQTHFLLEGTIYLNSFHLKWVVKRIKKLLKHKPLMDICLEDLNGN
jgi:predicted pyridoxine 5'-phosphate oxidase superfamily flavin-nucleotide-binding protein